MQMAQPQESFGGLFSVALPYLYIPTEPFRLLRSLTYDADENEDMDYNTFSDVNVPSSFFFHSTQFVVPNDMRKLPCVVLKSK